MLSLDECRSKFGEVWTQEREGVVFVFRWPEPDAFDEALGLAVNAEKGGDYRNGLKAFEIITKASCCSHTPAELDAIRRTAPPSGYMLFSDLGAPLLMRFRREAPEQGKD